MGLLAAALLIFPIYSHLVAVVELCRHGARTPTHFIKPWDNYTIWPQGPGELIPEGMRQHYLIGTELRRRYMFETQLLLPNYFQPEIRVFSSDVNRTLMSAESQIQGLYPAGTGPLLRSQLMETVATPPIDISDLSALNQSLGMSALPNLTQVIPIHSDEEIRQYALDAGDVCGYYSDMIDYKSQPSAELDSIFNEFSDVIQTIMQQMNYTEAKARSSQSSILDSLTSNLFVNNPFPLGFNQSFYDRGIILKNRLKNFYQFEPDIMARFSGTPLLNLILQDLLNVIAGNVTQKFFLYSAHDTTIMCALSFLLLNHTKNPPFASVMLFELHEYNQEYFVNIIYNDVLQNVSSCGGYNCSIYNFQRFIQVRSIPDYYNTCNLAFNSYNSSKLLNAKSDEFHWPGHDNTVNLHWYFWLSLGFYVAFGAVICLFAVLSTRLLKKKNSNTTEESMITIRN
jgi:hypothetical protein